MAIKEVEIYVKYSAKTVKYYMDKGYVFPTHKNKKNYKVQIKRGTEILVKVEDLTHSCMEIVTKICDICGVSVPQSYYNVIRYRNRSSDGLDKCKKCWGKYLGDSLAIAKDSKCIAATHPEFAKLFWNEEDTLIRTYKSNQRADSKCPQCGNKVENKMINNVYQNKKVPCYCNDNVPYPEKIMYSLLSQLNVNFETQKIFEWSKNAYSTNLFLNGTKRYDFYLNELNTIIETHGRQHSEKGFEKIGGRTVGEEQENDRIKELLAKENGIISYISIDCSRSEMEFIKMNILESQLNSIFDLSEIDWIKCHEFACSSFVKKACDLWNEGNSTEIIGGILKFERHTIVRYLKQGKILGLCDYEPVEVQRRKALALGKQNGKPIIQLSLQGEFIREWDSIAEAIRGIGKKSLAISNACRDNRKTAGGYKWMYKENYSPIKALEIGKIDIENRGKPIIQLSLQGEFIREWGSATEAYKELGINFRSISRVCKGSKLSAGGYKWIFKADFENQ
jgi:hypothetical protein